MFPKARHPLKMIIFIDSFFDCWDGLHALAEVIVQLGKTPLFDMKHNPRDDLRVPYMKASNPFMKMSANCFSVDMCHR